MFHWMAWTTPVAVFFTCMALMLLGMTVWEIKSPTVMRKGWLPIATTRGDRLFISILGSCFIMLLWVGFASAIIWGGLAICVAWAVFVFRYG